LVCGTIEQFTGVAALPPKSEGILESSLYVDDLVRSTRFYEKVFGFRVISDFGERGCAMQAGKHQVLLLFKKGGSHSIQSPHDGDGELHLAFNSCLGTGGVGSMATGQWDRGGREAHMGLGRPKLLLSGSGPPSHRNCDTRCLVDLLISYPIHDVRE
jgi:catechol 2,3-dioxygenase-like lactoylglutathione lyase family enzyme